MAGDILLTLLCAACAGAVLRRLRLPGGMMIGAVIGACLFGLSSGHARAPAELKLLAQILAGACIGAGVSRDELRGMRTILRPALILTPMFLVINLAAGLAIWAAHDMDLMTALLCCTPGGMSDMPIIAADMGADVSKVLTMQFVRFLMGIGLFPLLIRLIPGGGEAGGKTPGRKTGAARPYGAAVATGLVAAACGILGKISPLPAGAMTMATLGAMAFSCLYPKAWMPRGARIFAQCLSGTYVGSSIGLAQIRELPTLAVPILILLICYLGGAWVSALLLKRAGCFSLKEALLAATPAGASDMALISADLGIYNVQLVLLQVLRLIVVISLYPTILSLFTKLFQG